MAHEENDVSVYEEALERIQEEIEEVQKQETQLAIKKARLMESFEALLPLVCTDEDEVVDVNSLTLADAIRLVVRCSGRPLHMREIRSRLDEMGFKTMLKFKNPMASVHTAVKRMIESNEFAYIEDPQDGTNMIERGPCLKSAPFLDRDMRFSSRKTKEAMQHMASEKGQVKT
ncbi:MAG: hypothetical protein WAN65_19060 [Candidatus Sulfotelmatobacter sp.]